MRLGMGCCRGGRVCSDGLRSRCGSLVLREEAGARVTASGGRGRVLVPGPWDSVGGPEHPWVTGAHLGAE